MESLPGAYEAALPSSRAPRTCRPRRGRGAHRTGRGRAAADRLVQHGPAGPRRAAPVRDPARGDWPPRASAAERRAVTGRPARRAVGRNRVAADDRGCARRRRCRRDDLDRSGPADDDPDDRVGARLPPARDRLRARLRRRGRQGDHVRLVRGVDGARRLAPCASRAGGCPRGAPTRSASPSSGMPRSSHPTRCSSCRRTAASHRSASSRARIRCGRRTATGSRTSR